MGFPAVLPNQQLTASILDFNAFFRVCHALIEESRDQW